LALLIGQLVGASVLDAQPDDSRIVQIRCEHNGRFSKGYSWALTIDGDGQAILRVKLPSRDLVRKLSIRQGLQTIEKEIAKQGFFELPATMGRLVADGSTRKLTVETKQQEKTITIRYIWETDLNKDTRRALLLWDVIRGTFDEPQAFDSRPFDRAVLKVK
jgi:hypothetical protein